MARISLWSKSHILSWLLSWWLIHLILKAVIRHLVRNSYLQLREEECRERKQERNKGASASNSSFLQKEGRHELGGKEWHREETLTATLKKKKCFRTKMASVIWLHQAYVHSFSEKVPKWNQFSEVWCEHSLPHILFLFSPYNIHFLFFCIPKHSSNQQCIIKFYPYFSLWHNHLKTYTTGKTIALTRWTIVGKVMSLLFNMLSRVVIAFLPRSKCLLISWLQSHLQWFWSPKINVCHCFH